MKRTLFFISIITIISSYTLTGQTNVSGSIDASTTWDLAGSPYIVTGNIIINNGITLTINDGVEVHFQANTGIEIRGTLNAVNTTMTSASGTRQKGDWQNIQVGSSLYSGILNMDGCVVEYGGGNSISENMGMIYVYNGSATIFGNSEISKSSNQGILISSNGVLNLEQSIVSSCRWPIVYNGPGEFNLDNLTSLTGNEHDGIYIRFTKLSTDFILPESAIPFVFYRNFIVNSGNMLTIGSGNIIKTNSSITVNGALKAIADMGENIYFTTYLNDNLGGDTNNDGAATTPSSRSWGTVKFTANSDDANCILKRCVFSFGGSGLMGAVSLESASPTIDSCEFNNNYYGVKLEGPSYPLFRYNDIGSSELVPIAMSFDADPVFQNNFFSFSDNEYDAIGLLGGTLAANAELKQRDVTGIPNVTYVMLGTLIIPEDLSLVINSGIVIKGYTSSHRFVVKGTLVADGIDPSNRIVFTSMKDDNHGNPMDTNKDGSQSFPNPGDWGGIVFENSSSDTSRLAFCHLKYGKLPSRYYNTRHISGGTITTENASPTISNCLIKDTEFGIYAFQASNPRIYNNEISNTTKTPVALSVSADPDFDGNTFVNTGWTALGLIGEKLGFDGTIKLRNVAGFDAISYVLLEDLTVNSGTYVDVEPGVVIKMNNNTDIFVEGGFKATGTASDSIVFTSIHDDNFGNPKDTRDDGDANSPSPGNWGTINFLSTADDGYNLISYAMILYGGRSNKGLVTFTDAGGEIHDILLSSSDHNGIRCEGASTPLCQTNVEIKNCNSDPIAMSLKANPTFSFSGMTMKSNGNGSNGIRIIEGTLSSDASLVPRDVGGIYNIAYIVDKLTIAAGAKLTIHQGVVIKFIGHTSLIKVEGALIADGISEDKIVFTSLKDDSRGGDTNDDGNNSVPLKGDWWSISFHGSAMDHESILDNCVLNYGGANRPGYGDLKDFGTIRIIDAAITIDSCMIEQSSTSAFGIYGSASPSFTKCGIHNIRYTPVTMSMFASPFFSGNVVSNLGIAAIGIAKETYALDGTIPVRNFAGYNNITYFMYRTCKVNSGTILTIPAGVVFKSGAYDCFEVEGTINIEGTKASPVVFTHEHDDMHGNPRDTNEDGDDSSPTVMSNYGLNFADISNDTSTISNAVFRYKNAGINLHQASPKIKECTFNACDFGIILRGVSHPEVDSCTFDDLTLTPLLMSLVSYPASTQANQITGHTYKALGVLSEVLVQDITLEKRNFAGIDNISYFFHGDYTIGTSVVLTVSPGLVLKFNKNAELLVQRGLIAEGGSTADSNIVFTDYRDDFYGGDINADGNESEPDFWNWGGIRFDNQALDNLCRLKYCIIRYAGRYSNEAAITTQVASPSITNCVIAYNRNGVRAEGASNPLINYCDIYENEDYGVNNVNKAFVINARHNWWGSATGPTHSTNPGGLGELVSDAVDFGDFGGLTNPVMGDVSLNGKVQAYDASLVLKEVIHMMMFLPQQAEVADVSHDGSITAYDASLILQYVAGSILTFPAELKSTSIETLNDAKIRFEVLGPDENNQFQLIVSGESIDRFSSLEIPLIMDLSQLSLSAIETTTLSKEMMLMHHMDHESSTLRIALAGQENFRDDGELLRIILSANRNSSELVITPGTVLLNEEPSRIYPGRINVHGGALPVFADPVDKLPLDISPLPMVDYLSISFTVPESNNKILISMHDLQGRTIQIIREGNLKPGNYKVFLDKSDLRPSVVRGTYLLRYHDGKNVHVKKIVIH